MTQHPRDAEIREAQIADTVRIVRDLMGGRDASEVRVEVTRGGTYRVEAKADGGAKVVEYATIGRRK